MNDVDSAIEEFLHADREAHGGAPKANEKEAKRRNLLASKCEIVLKRTRARHTLMAATSVGFVLTAGVFIAFVTEPAIRLSSAASLIALAAYFARTSLRLEEERQKVELVLEFVRDESIAIDRVLEIILAINFPKPTERPPASASTSAQK